MSARNLRLTENKGTTIRHRKYKTEAIIVGSMTNAFIVEMNISKDTVFPLKLPFKNIDQWEVVEDHRTIGEYEYKHDGVITVRKINKKSEPKSEYC